MLIQTRSSLPFMPQGTANQTNAPTPLYAPGELNMAFADQSTGRIHRRVILDSGATSATATGAVAAGQLAFWKDKAAGLVTNHKPACDLGPTAAINRVAGVFPLAVTAGYYCDIIIAGRNIPCVSDGSGVLGSAEMADTTASTARVVGGAAANTAPVSQVIGYATSLPVANVVNVDVFIGDFAGS